MFEFLKNKKSYLIVALLALVVGGGAALAFQNSQNSKKYEIYSVQPVEIGQTAEATGFLEPTTSIDLSFQKSGEVSDVFVDVGKRVKKGELLAQLVHNNEKALLAQSKAVLAEAKATLNLKVADATDQDIAIARADVQQSVASKQKVQVDYNNALTDLENTKKTVEQDNKTAELNVTNAKLNLQKVTINSSTATQQTDTSVGNAVLAFKTASNQLLVAAKALLQNMDKIFGFEGPSLFGFDGPSSSVNLNSARITTTLEYANAQTLFSNNLTSYKNLRAKFDALPPSPSPSDLLLLSLDISTFIGNLNSGTLAVSVALDKINTTEGFNYSDLAQLRTDITNSGSTFNTAATNYNSSKKSLDDAVINQSGTGNTSPLDVQSAQLQVNQAEQNLTKTQVNGLTLISSKETFVKAEQAQLQVAQSQVDKSNAQLEKILSSPRAVDIAPYQAQVQQAQAQVDKAQSDYDNTLLRAPFDGIITIKNIDVGEQFFVGLGASNKAALGIIDDSEFHIDVNIPETQITKISTDSKTTVTFDALGSAENFEGKILSIEPASSSVQDIIYYKAKIALVKTDPKLKAGMTANVSIVTNSTGGVLAIPERAVTIDENNEKTVMIGPNQTLIIRTGIKGDHGMIEIASGLKAGDTILVPVN